MGDLAVAHVKDAVGHLGRLGIGVSVLPDDDRSNNSRKVA
jgi:hypothetical protein